MAAPSVTVNSARVSSMSVVRAWAWITLGIVVATIVMGAVVRATHSGDGCGASWPACEGRLVFPGTDDTSRLIEFSHRAISGLSLLVMAGLVVLVHRAFPAPHAARKAVRWSMALLVLEALIGAAIVLYGWVAENESVARQVSVPIHLVNTFLLTASIALTVWLIEGGSMPVLRGSGRRGKALLGLSLFLLLIAATGATTSLADTLFAAESLTEGIRADFAGESEFIVRLRIFHPFLAITGGALLGWFAYRHMEESEGAGHAWPARFVLGGVLFQALLGFVHIALLTPLATGLLHLFIAQALWISLVFLALALLQPREGHRATPPPGSATASSLST